MGGKGNFLQAIHYPLLKFSNLSISSVIELGYIYIFFNIENKFSSALFLKNTSDILDCLLHGDSRLSHKIESCSIY